MISRKQAILEVAAGFFSERGYRETAMSEVAKEAGVADGTVFYNYRTKEELYLAVLDDFRGQIALALDEYLTANEFNTGLQRVEGLIGFYINLGATLADRFLLLHRYDPYRIARTNPAFRRQLESIYNCIVDEMEKAILLGQQDGSIVDVPARKYALIVFALVDGLVRLNTFNVYQADTLYGELIGACRRMLARSNH